MGAQFVATPWRDGKELLDVRACLFRKDGDEDRREQAVNKIFAWRLRKHQIPLLLESTADIIDVMLQEERHGLEHNALRLLYATAVSRFITGLSDSLTDLTRLRPSFFPPGQTLILPPSLLETRHCIVHRQLPSLATLKSAARQSLDWLWEWYWSQLDSVFKSPSTVPTSLLNHEEVKTEIQAILKSYMRARKTEIKTSRTSSMSEAAQTALATYTTLFTTSFPPSAHETLLDLLIYEKAILPSDKKLGSSMSGAFLVWTPLLLSICSAFSSTQTTFVDIVVEQLMLFMNAKGPFGVEVREDPVKEGMHAWLVRVLTSGEWSDTRAVAGKGNDSKFVERVLSLLFLTPSYWNLKVSEDMLEAYEDLPGREGWMSVLGAAREQDDEMEAEEQAGEVDLEKKVQGELGAEGIEVRDVSPRKESGPRKRVGMWRPTYIGALPVGWEDDE